MTDVRLDPTPEVVQSSLQRWILGTLCIGTFMAMLDNVVVSNALPRIDRDLGAGISGVQWVVEAYSLVFAALLLTGGTLGDRLGRRRLYLAGLTLFTVGSAMSALAPTLALLIGGRAVQGLGAAALIPQSLAILRVTYPQPVSQAKAFALWSGVSALGLALGPVIGGPLVDAFGWPSAFWINVPIGLVSLAIGSRVIPETHGRPGGFDLVGQIAAATALATMVYALIEGPTRGWGSRPILAALGASVIAGLIFLRSQTRTSQPAFDHTLLRDRVVRAAILAGFAVTFGMFGVITFLGLFMQDILGWSPTGAGVASLPATVTIILVAPLASRLTLTHGPRRPLVAGLISCALALLWLSCFGPQASYLQYCWSLPLLGIGLGLCYTPVTMVVMTRVPVDRAGNASAATNISRELGGVAGIAVMGTLISTWTSSSLTGRLADLGVSGRAIDQIVTATTAGGQGGLARLTSTPEWIRAAIEQSFVEGLHVALWAAAAFLLGCAALIFYLARPSSAPAEV